MPGSTCRLESVRSSSICRTTAATIIGIASGTRDIATTTATTSTGGRIITGAGDIIATIAVGIATTIVAIITIGAIITTGTITIADITTIVTAGIIIITTTTTTEPR